MHSNMVINLRDDSRLLMPRGSVQVRVNMFIDQLPEALVAYMLEAVFA
jgi:hypothetical protein